MTAIITAKKQKKSSSDCSQKRWENDRKIYKRYKKGLAHSLGEWRAFTWHNYVISTMCFEDLLSVVVVDIALILTNENYFRLL